jgi:hypothetical protein
VTSSAWAPLKAERTQQLLDILHVSHMWEIGPGLEFASKELLKFDLHPAHRLHLARQYGLLNVNWINIPVRMLLGSPLERYKNEDDTNNLDFRLYMLIATAKESIATARKVLANHPPFPTDSDYTPFCPQHATCKRVWIEKWFLVLGRKIHHPTEHFALISIPEELKNMEHRGMNSDCKNHVLEWIDRTFLYLIRKEEDLIQETIALVYAMFT